MTPDPLRWRRHRARVADGAPYVAPCLDCTGIVARAYTGPGRYHYRHHPGDYARERMRRPE